jgi:4-amino-4-deoxy-L-arabinose transferase-like glycosyltransferase
MVRHVLAPDRERPIVASAPSEPPKASLRDALQRRSRIVLLGVLLAAAFIVRVDGVMTPSVEPRELHNGLVARQFYYGDGGGLPAWKQRVLAELGDVVRPIEPPVLDLIAAGAFRLAGGEELWIPRLVSTLFWIVGGVFLYLIAARLTRPDGALVALAVYLFWPYGAFISRLYMPDAMMVALLLAATLTVIRYWEQPSLGRLVAAGAVSAAATAAKPGVALLFLLAVFIAIAASRRVLIESVTRGRVPLFVALAVLPSLVYYVYGTQVKDFLAGQSEGRIEPALVATTWFWAGWWEMVSIVLRFPQAQAYLALVPLAAGAAGVVAARPGTPRATILGLGVGYVAFAFMFTAYVPSHPYYSLPLVPILALSMGALTGFFLERLDGRRNVRRALLAFVALVIGIAAFKTHAVLTPSAPARQIADYERIGEVTAHTTRAIYVDMRLRSPISYWGWMVGNYWYPPTPAQDLPTSGDPFPAWIDAAESEYLIVVEVSELETEPRLRAFTRALPVVERTSRYAVFDLRGGRALEAERRSRTHD